MTNVESSFEKQVESGDRFRFGANWARFLEVVDERRIDASVLGLRSMLGVDGLEGSRFLDVGSGSGLSSLAATRLGASVQSFDFDPESVACTTELRRRFYDGDDWQIRQGSVLDRDFLSTLEPADIVYSWGVLHHTGRMWEAMDNVCALVGDGGTLFIALYKDQGRSSAAWTRVKHLYNRMPRWLRWVILVPAAVQLWGGGVIRRIRGTGASPSSAVGGAAASGRRGMTRWHDLIDWVGGYPFEVASTDEVERFCAVRGLDLVRTWDCGTGHGCNEYVFVRRSDG